MGMRLEWMLWRCEGGRKEIGRQPEEMGIEVL